MKLRSVLKYSSFQKKIKTKITKCKPQTSMYQMLQWIDENLLILVPSIWLVTFLCSNDSTIDLLPIAISQSQPVWYSLVSWPVHYEQQYLDEQISSILSSSMPSKVDSNTTKVFPVSTYFQFDEENNFIWYSIHIQTNWLCNVYDSEMVHHIPHVNYIFFLCSYKY